MQNFLVSLILLLNVSFPINLFNVSSFSSYSSSRNLNWLRDIWFHWGRNSMDLGRLRGCIQSTVDPNADIRRQAELDLKYVYVLHCSILNEKAKQRITGWRATRIHQCPPRHPASWAGQCCSTIVWVQVNASTDTAAKAHQLWYTSRIECLEGGRPETRSITTSRYQTPTSSTSETEFSPSLPHLLPRFELSSYLYSRKYCNMTSPRNGLTSWTLRCGYWTPTMQVLYLLDSIAC